MERDDDDDQKKHISSSKHDPHITSSVGVRGADTSIIHLTALDSPTVITPGRGRCLKPCSVAQGPCRGSPGYPGYPSPNAGDGVGRERESEGEKGRSTKTRKKGYNFYHLG